MSVPVAKTKMTRSNWSRAKRPNTKGADLSRSKGVTVMSRYGGKSISRYATTYMSRDNAAMPAVEEVGVVPHDVDVDNEVSVDDVSVNDVSRQSRGISHDRRLFDQTGDSLSVEELSRKMKAFDDAQRKGHTSIIQVISFSHDYLVRQRVLTENHDTRKGYLARDLDDAKLRQAIRTSVDAMATQAGFSKLEYVAAVHGNTEHPHVHLAMIETDDDATGRLAAREAVTDDQQASETTAIVGKSPAALRYDKAHHVSDTVERGMMRQSEIDFFRQTIDGSLTNMSKLVTVRDLEYQRSYASVVNLDVLRKSANNTKFMEAFIALHHDVPTFDSQTDVTQALDIRVEKMSRMLLSGTDVGQKQFMQSQYQLGTKLAKERALESAVRIHRIDKPSVDDVADYESMGLDIALYNGVVKTPVQFSEANPDLSANQYLAYVDRYKSFILDPSLKNLDGLVLKNPSELNVSSDVASFVAQQDQLLVDMTKSSIYELLSRASGTSLDDKKLADALGKTLRNINSSSSKTPVNDDIEAFQQRLKRTGLNNAPVPEKVTEIVITAERARDVNTLPSEIVSARKLLQDSYAENIQDLTLMMSVSSGKHISQEDRMKLLEQNRDLREVTLGTGDLTKAGSMLHAALSAEIGQTGAIERVHKLKLDEKDELFLAYREATVSKMSSVATAIQDLNSGTSFTEKEEVQSLRVDLTDALQEMNDGYGARLEYVTEVENIASLDDVQERESLAQLMLSQVLWRQGVEEGKTSAEITQSVREASTMSTEDKLATAMTMTLQELDANIEAKSDEALVIAKTMQTYVDEYDASTPASEMIATHMSHYALSDVPDVYEGLTPAEMTTDVDMVYDPASYTFTVNDKNVLQQETVPKDKTLYSEMTLDVVVDRDAKLDVVELNQQRYLSQSLNYADMVVVDNHIKQAYDERSELTLYDKQQEIANVTDVSLSNDVRDLNEFRHSAIVQSEVVNHDTSLSRQPEREVAVVEAAQTPKRNTVSRKSNRKGQEISR